MGRRRNKKNKHRANQTEKNGNTDTRTRESVPTDKLSENVEEKEGIEDGHEREEENETQNDVEDLFEKTPEVTDFFDEMFLTDWQYLDYDFEQTSSEVEIIAKPLWINNLSEKIRIEFNETSLLLAVKDVRAVHILSVPRLAYEINPEESKYLIKNGRIILYLRKLKPWQWSTLHYLHPAALRNFNKKFQEMLKVIKNATGKTCNEPAIHRIRFQAEKLAVRVSNLESLKTILNLSEEIPLRNEDETIEYLMEYLTTQQSFSGFGEYIFCLAVVVLIKEKKTCPRITSKNCSLKSNCRSSETLPMAKKAKEEGNVYFKEKKFSLAIAAYTRAIALDPKCPIYYLNRCIAYFYMSRPDNCLTDAWSVLKLDFFHTKVYLYLGKFFHSIGFTNKADFCLRCAKILDHSLPGVEEEITKVTALQNNIKIFTDLIKEKKLEEGLKYASLIFNSTSSFMIFRKIVEDLCKEGLFLEAKSVANSIILKSYEENLFLLGTCAYFEDDEQAVHKNFSEYLSRDPRNYHATKRFAAIKDIYNTRQEGDEAFARRDFEKAIKSYLKGLELNNKFYGGKELSSKFFYKIARAHLQRGKKGEAIFNLEAAIKLKSNYHEALSLRGECLFHMGNYEAGLNDIEKAYKLCPSNSYKQLLERLKQERNLSQPEKRKKWTCNQNDVIEKQEAELKKALANTKKAKGNQFFKDGKYNDAIEAYDEAIKLDSTNPIFFSNRSACYLAIKNFKNALQDAQCALNIDPTYIKAWLKLGKAQIALGQADEAVKSLEKATKLGKNHPDIKTEMQRAYSLKDAIEKGNSGILNEDYVNAEEHFSAAVKLAENCGSLQLKKIECLYHLKRYEDVLLAIESAFCLDAQNPTLHYFKALCCYQKGERNETISLLEKALSIDPLQTNVSETLEKVKKVFHLKGLGNKAYLENRLDDALMHYSKGLKEDATNLALNGVFYFNIGLVHRKKASFKEAIDFFSSAIAFNKDYVKAYLNRAECYLKTSFIEEAVEDYEIVVKLSPCASHEKLLKEAKEELEIQIKLNNERELETSLAECKLEKGKQYVKRNKYNEALECFSKAIILNPKCPSYYISSCQCHISMKNYYEAVSDAEKSVEIDPSYLEGHIMVGKCNLALGNAEKAIAAYEKAKELDSNNQEIINKVANSLKLKRCLSNGNKSLKDRDFAVASEEFKTASEIAVWNLSLILDRVKCLIYLHRMTEVFDIMESLTSEMKENSKFLSLKGTMFYYQDQKDDALSCLQSSLEIDPSNEDTKEMIERIEKVYNLKEKGNNAFLKRDFTEAFSYYTEALGVETENRVIQSKLHFNIGILHMKQGFIKKAINSFSTAISLNDEYIKALEKRALCYQKTKDLELATHDYQKLHNLTTSETYLKLLQDTLRQIDTAPQNDYYSILGLSRDSSMEEIKKSYKHFALKYHPDKMKTEADKIVGENKFKELRKAYSVLIDPSSRKRYDRGETEEEFSFAQADNFYNFPFFFKDFMFRRF